MQIVTKDSETGTELGIYNNLWAVVVGINKYQYWQRLTYAVQDAEAIAELLKTKYGIQEDHIILIKDEQATLQGIKDALSDLIVKTGKDDGVIFYFAGHGQTFKTLEGKEMGYMIPVDGRLEEAKLYTTTLAMSEVKNLCNLIPAKHILFLVDACYSGLAAATDYRGTLTKETKGFLNKITKAKTRHIITAGGAGEQVQEREEWGHSAFTYELLNALEREQADYDYDGIVTADELADYLTSRVSRITNNAQLPQSKRLSVDDGKFVFVPSRASAENVSEIKTDETEKSDAKKKEEIKTSPTKEIVIEPELKMPRGFYLFYGVGVVIGHDPYLSRYTKDQSDVSGAPAIIGNFAALPALGYRINDNYSLDLLAIWVSKIDIAYMLFEVKGNISLGKVYPFLKIGGGTDPIEHEAHAYASFSLGIDYSVSKYFTFTGEIRQIDNINRGEEDFKLLNIFVSYHF